MMRVEETTRKPTRVKNKIRFVLTSTLKSFNFLDLELTAGFLVVVSLQFVRGDIVFDKSFFLG